MARGLPKVLGWADFRLISRPWLENRQRTTQGSLTSARPLWVEACCAKLIPRRRSPYRSCLFPIAEVNSRICAPISSAGFGTTTTLFAVAAWVSANTASITTAHRRNPESAMREETSPSPNCKDIDDEVADALKFEPTLSESTMATTAPNDAKLQALWRRITDHPRLVRKAFRLRRAIFYRRQDRRDSRGDPACRRQSSAKGLARLAPWSCRSPRTGFSAALHAGYAALDVSRVARDRPSEFSE